MILNIYKPKGLTSFDVVTRAKFALKVKKVGHAGTLDPLAEGVLVLLTDKDTQKQEQIMKLVKEYEAEIVFGAETPSLDLEFVPTFIKQISLDEVKQKIPEIIKKFIGEIDQQLPNFSAKKVEGTPLYKWAHKGLDPQAQEKYFKKVRINQIDVLNYGQKEIETDKGKFVLPSIFIKVSCEHGTFIRALARDFGTDLGCGGVITKLVRTKVGGYKIEDAQKLEDLKPQNLVNQD